jgi:hypothetical protein
MMARNTNVPFKGRIQKRKTYHLQIITFRLQRAAGPYSCARRTCASRVEYELTKVGRELTFRLGISTGASAPRNPMVGSFPACCAGAASGHAAAVQPKV